MWNDILINILEDGLFAAIAAIGFSSISNTPGRAYLTCGLIAAAGHTIRYVLTTPEFGIMRIIPASLGVICHRCARRAVCRSHKMSCRSLLLSGFAPYDTGYVRLSYYRGSFVTPLSYSGGRIRTLFLLACI